MQYSSELLGVVGEQLNEVTISYRRVEATQLWYSHSLVLVMIFKHCSHYDSVSILVEAVFDVTACHAIISDSALTVGKLFCCW